eukprot:TRINITY_DN7058_c0_g1_i1.p1 TRINITY_DN7058_c0_g1~~TRINITY_DN7058_c0_g1_i1.p1  ORF type:complete len:360 (+),score=168.93 TRINITY_DN7058_c0_g1_i1:94-1173(+)
MATLTDRVGLSSVDVHTHVYLPRYMQMMRDRKLLPRVVKDDANVDRLLILPEEESEEFGVAKGRPIGTEYWDVNKKIEWMNDSGIETAVLSLANPWLDFMSGDEASQWSTELNNDMNTVCGQHEGKFFGFGVLPVGNPRECAAELDRIAASKYLRGVIMGTGGIGKGLDDPEMNPIWQRASELGLTIFLHPHYGVGNEAFTDRYGHALLLALGFPFETSTAVCRMVLSGVLARHPKLKVLLAHSGGTLPFLAGRLDSCVASDPFISAQNGLDKKPTEYLKQLYYDAVCYHSPSITATREFVGEYRMMFGTDHPFSIANPEMYYESFAKLDEDTKNLIRHGNAQALLGLHRDKRGILVPN